MVVIGSDDGIYRVPERHDTAESEYQKLLDTERVMRLRAFEPVDGVFAATRSGLFYSADGDAWTDLAVPREQVYAVGSSPSGDRLYAGTRPAAVYVTDLPEEIRSIDLQWRELDDFQTLPSREQWRLPRHENLAQVRDVHSPGEDLVVAGVEVGGVHASVDGGETWEERRGANHDDVHELHAASADEWLSATGDGLYRTTDAGGSWHRLDENVEQSYFRSVIAADGLVYASGARANSSTWNDDDANPDLFRWNGDTLTTVALPTDGEMVTGLTTVGDDALAGTHRGTLLARRKSDWVEVGGFPVPGQLTGRYTPIAAPDWE